MEKWENSFRLTVRWKTLLIFCSECFLSIARTSKSLCAREQHISGLQGINSSSGPYRIPHCSTAIVGMFLRVCCRGVGGWGGGGVSRDHLPKNMRRWKTISRTAALLLASLMQNFCWKAPTTNRMQVSRQKANHVYDMLQLFVRVCSMCVRCKKFPLRVCDLRTQSISKAGKGQGCSG